jgi:hypothetical protein
MMLSPICSDWRFVDRFYSASRLCEMTTVGAGASLAGLGSQSQMMLSVQRITAWLYTKTGQVIVACEREMLLHIETAHHDVSALA